MLPFVKRMVIDESKNYILTNYRQVGKTGKSIDSDHFTEYLDLDIALENVKTERVEILTSKKKSLK